MKTAVIVVALIAAAVVLALVGLAVMSRSGKPPGLVEGRLAPCPASPNCVVSEAGTDAAHHVAPFTVPGGAEEEAFRALEEVIGEMGGMVETRREGYLAATFSSTVFGFVDDFEARLDAAEGVLHVRSASRVGRSDLGVNRQRVQRIRAGLSGRVVAHGSPS